jgi:hypothetical protein
MEFQWNKTTDSLPAEGKRVLLATLSRILIGQCIGRDEDGPVFTGDDHFIIYGVYFWADIPPRPTIAIQGRDGAPGESGESIVIAGGVVGPAIANLVIKGGDSG